MQRVHFSFELGAPLERVWAFHSDPAGLGKIMPGPLRVTQWDQPLRAGSRILFRMGTRVLGADWLLHVTTHKPMEKFVDEQVRGPFACWKHMHAFEAVGAASTRVTDEIEFALPLWPLCAPAELIAARVIMPLTMAYRQRATRRLLAA